MSEIPNIKLLENKLDLLLEQVDLVLKSNAHLRADLPEIIKESIIAVLNKHAIQGYSRINS